MAKALSAQSITKSNISDTNDTETLSKRLDSSIRGICNFTYIFQIVFEFLGVVLDVLDGGKVTESDILTESDMFSHILSLVMLNNY